MPITSSHDTRCTSLPDENYSFDWRNNYTTSISYSIISKNSTRFLFLDHVRWVQKLLRRQWHANCHILPEKAGSAARHRLLLWRSYALYCSHDVHSRLEVPVLHTFLPPQSLRTHLKGGLVTWRCQKGEVVVEHEYLLWRSYWSHCELCHYQYTHLQTRNYSALLVGFFIL